MGALVSLGRNIGFNVVTVVTAVIAGMIKPLSQAFPTTVLHATCHPDCLTAGDKGEQRDIKHWEQFRSAIKSIDSVV